MNKIADSEVLKKSVRVSINLQSLSNLIIRQQSYLITCELLNIKMFQKRGLLVIFLLLVCLASCAEQHPTNTSNHPNQPKTDEMIVVNSDTKQKTIKSQNKTQNNHQPQQQSKATSNEQSHSGPKTQNKSDKIIDKGQIKFAQEKSENQQKSQTNNFNNQFEKMQSLESMAFNSQQPINQQWKQQARQQRQIEQLKKKEEQKMQAEELYSWIAEQMAQQDSEQERIVSESFQISMEPYGVYNFRWNPPKSQLLHLKVMVFELNDERDMTLMKQNQQSEYIEVSYRNEGHITYTVLGKVYIQRSFKFNFDTDYKYFRLHNNMDRNLLLIVDLQKLNEVVLPQGRVKNDHFSAMTAKLTAIDNEVSSGQKLRQHSYKYQWGFLQNQYTHDSRLLGLTGLELLIIIAAAIVQVYFIKALLDNRAIV